ncbi:MAG: hypothetical protein IJZ42_01625 [Lachnospiraceae bacterium]|nr:hypothetical protein [Lachnospiraceae bacterium]
MKIYEIILCVLPAVFGDLYLLKAMVMDLCKEGNPKERFWAFVKGLGLNILAITELFIFVPELFIFVLQKGV